MAEGVGFAGEGDLIGAVGTWFFNGLAGAATFSEIFTIDFAGQSLFMSHMGEANVALARTDRPIMLTSRASNIVPTIQKQNALEFSPQPGPATLAVLFQGPDNLWRIVGSKMEVLDFGPMNEKQAVPYFKLAPVSADVRSWLTAYGQAGGPHHNVLCVGDVRRRIKFTADLLGADYVEV